MVSEFQSPIGEVCIEADVHRAATGPRVSGFNPLSGKCALKHEQSVAEGRRNGQFQSPIGEVCIEAPGKTCSLMLDGKLFQSPIGEVCIEA